MRIRFTTGATRDLDAIFTYWAQRTSLQIAERLLEAIEEQVALLAEHPLAGRKCDELAAGVRVFPAGKYLVYYRAVRRRVEVLHIFHGAREQRSAWHAE